MDLSVEERVRFLTERYSAEADVYERMWAGGLRNVGLELLEHLPLGEAGTVLDLGTGVGSLLPDIEAAAPNALILGVDRAEGMLRHSPRRFPIAVVDAMELPFKP